ncbi:MAG: pitrilysin family protein, partial [candidate division WOR-3 bacterium]
ILLTRGTTSRSAIQLNQEVEFVGGRLSSAADFDHLTVNLQVLARDTRPALDLLSDMVLRPAFSDSELARAKREVIAEIRRQADEPGDILYKEFYRQLFGAHPYGHPVIGHDSTVAAITRQQVLEFYERWFAPNNCYLVVVGDFFQAELKSQLQRQFGPTARHPVSPIEDRPLTPFTVPRGRIITRPEMNQAYVFLGHAGVREGMSDLYALRLMNYILGGSGLGSRLGVAIRQNRGLAYDARSFFDRRQLVGGFAASTQTRTESAMVAIELIRSELRRIRDEVVSDYELKKAKDYFVGSFPLDYEGVNQKLAIMDRIELYHLGTDYVDRFADRVRAVTRDQVLKAAQDHLFPDNYLLVVVGNLSEQDIRLPGLEWIHSD